MPRSVSLIREIGNGSDFVVTIKQAPTVGQLLDLIPESYRVQLSVVVQEVFNAARKANNARSYLASLQKHKVDGTFPSEIGGRVNPPTLQISKEYSASAGWRSHETALNESTTAHKRALLDEAIQVKVDEVAFLQSIFAETKWKATVETLIKEITVELASDGGVVIDPQVGISEKSLPSWLVPDYATIKATGTLFPGRAVALAHAANQKETMKKFKSLSLKRASDNDVEMQDSTDRNDTVIAIVQKELAKALKASNLQNPGNRNAKKPKSKPKPKQKSPPRVSKKGSPNGSNGRGRKSHRSLSK